MKGQIKAGAFFKRAIRRYFLLGLIILLPFYVTFKFFIFFVDYFESALAVHQGRFLYVIPAELHPDQLLGVHIPGLGILFSIATIFIVGILSRNYFGRRLVRGFDNWMGRIPLARVIYNVVKQALETYAYRDKRQFSRVVIIEFPRKGLYSLAFVTGVAVGEVQAKTKETVINVFMPTTPNPTSGFYLMVPERDVIPLEMSIEDAFKLIISGGMVSPDHKNSKTFLDDVE